MSSTRSAMLPTALQADDPAWVEISERGLGVYVHVPFCAHRCGYCDFAAFDGLDDLRAAYVEKVRREITARVAEPAATVFVGGGTPSRLGPDLLNSVLASIPMAPDAECTVEMNPGSATPDVIAAAVAAGANRVSIGMQSARSHVLEFLERGHRPETVTAAVTAARQSGVDEINLDLIFGTPSETAADWEATLEAALDLDPDHISAYALTVEPATPLGRAVAAGRRRAPDDDVCADRLARTAQRLADAGFVRYEISNWTKSRPCLHNMRYWSDGPYVGVGSGAHSYDPLRRVRRWNVRHPRTYIDASDMAGLCAGTEALTPEEVGLEQIMLGMRRSCGMEAHMVTIPPELRNSGLLDCENGRVRLTDAGMSVANGVICELSLASREC